jgi:hypothetical protein
MEIGSSRQHSAPGMEAAVLDETIEKGKSISQKIYQSRGFKMTMGGFWSTFVLHFVVSGPFDNIIGQFIDIRSEYTIGEQLSKFYLFIIMLVALHLYRTSKTPSKVMIGLLFFLFAFVMYLSESNMVVEIVQPLFGVIFLPLILFLLLQTRSFGVIFALILGFMMLAGGAFIDFMKDSETLQGILPSAVVTSPLIREEIWEIIGYGLIGYAVLAHFYEDIRAFVRNNVAGTVLLLLASGMLASGNSFLHWQYSPGLRVQSVALTMTLIGFAGLAISNRYLIKPNDRIRLITEESFYLFLFAFFVMLPIVFGNSNIIVSLLLWLPSILLAGYFMMNHHPLLRTAGRGFAFPFQRVIGRKIEKV